MSETLPVVLADPGRQLSAADLRTRVNLIQEVMRAVMKDGTHYGVIPGTNKPTLYKAGSEVLLTTFRIAVDPEVEDVSSADEVRYRVRCRAIHQPTGELLGVGVGEASSSEDKWAWRKAVCDEEFQATAENRRRLKFGKGERGVYTVQQVRTTPADFANTVLKMAKKRAQIDMTLTVTGASDIFTQDLDEDDARDPDDGAPPPLRSPKRKSEGAPAPAGAPPAQTPGATESPPATEAQKKMIYAKLKNAGITAGEFAQEFGTSIEELSMKEVNAALDLIQKGWA